MKTTNATLEIEGKKVQIILTKEQLDSINSQMSKYTINDIDSYETACKILGRDPIAPYEDKQDWASHQLKTIIVAANFIDNDNEIWKPDFLSSDEVKYYPYFERNPSGWVFRFCFDLYYSGSVGFGFYFKKIETCIKIANKFLPLYSEWLG